VYDKEGRFLPQMFEDLFAKWDVGNEGALSAGQLLNMIGGNRLVADPFGVSGVVICQISGLVLISVTAVGGSVLRVWNNVGSSSGGWESVQGGFASGV